MDRTITIDLSSVLKGIAVGEPHPMPQPRPQTGPGPRPQFPFPFPKPVLQTADVRGFAQDVLTEAADEQSALDVEGYAYWILGGAVIAGVVAGSAIAAGGLYGAGYSAGERSQLKTAQTGIGYHAGYAAGKAAGKAGD